MLTSGLLMSCGRCHRTQSASFSLVHAIFDLLIHIVYFATVVQKLLFKIKMKNGIILFKNACIQFTVFFLEFNYLLGWIIYSILVVFVVVGYCC